MFVQRFFSTFLIDIYFSSTLIYIPGGLKKTQHAPQGLSLISIWKGFIKHIQFLMVTRMSCGEVLFKILLLNEQFSSSYEWFGGHTYFQNVYYFVTKLTSKNILLKTIFLHEVHTRLKAPFAPFAYAFTAIKWSWWSFSYKQYVFFCL